MSHPIFPSTFVVLSLCFIQSPPLSTAVNVLSFRYSLAGPISGYEKSEFIVPTVFFNVPMPLEKDAVVFMLSILVITVLSIAFRQVGVRSGLNLTI